MINKVISKFPERDIIVLSNMTPKALFHDQGIAVVKDPETNIYENLDEMTDAIDTEIEDKQEEIENTKEKQQQKNLKAEVKSLERKHAKAVKLIDVDGKVLVPLDTPDHNLLANIAPILSHDRYEQEYRYVDSNSGPIRTKTNVIRGFPTVIYTQASDQINRERFVEETLLLPNLPTAAFIYL